MQVLASQAMPSGASAVYAYLGPQGTYSHQAALLAAEMMGHQVDDATGRDKAAGTEHVRDNSAGTASNYDNSTHVAADPRDANQFVECTSISEVFELIKRGRVTWGIVPIENALEGSVNETLDAFAFHSKAFIVCELVLDIHHNLVVQPGTSLADIKTVASHPQALAQCREWLLANCPGVRTLATTSTAEAVRGLAQEAALVIPDSAQNVSQAHFTNAQAASDERHIAAQYSNATAHQAAIGTALAAQLFGAQVAATQIEDHFGNQTRFVVMGNKMAKRTGNDKTSLALFMKEDRPGTLLMILAEFAYAGLNLTKIQSRPTKQALGDYMFWIDVDGHADDLDLKTALDSLRLKLREVKLLGSYPKAL